MALTGGAAAEGEHGPVDLVGGQRWLGQRVGAVGAEAVQQQAQMPPPGVGGAGGPDRRQDAAVVASVAAARGKRMPISSLRPRSAARSR